MNQPTATMRLDDGREITTAITYSAGTDGAVLVLIDTTFEPNASDGGPGLRVLVNDEPVYAGVAYSRETQT